DLPHGRVRLIAGYPRDARQLTRRLARLKSVGEQPPGKRRRVRRGICLNRARTHYENDLAPRLPLAERRRDLRDWAAHDLLMHLGDLPRDDNLAVRHAPGQLSQRLRKPDRRLEEDDRPACHLRFRQRLTALVALALDESEEDE